MSDNRLEHDEKLAKLDHVWLGYDDLDKGDYDIWWWVEKPVKLCGQYDSEASSERGWASPDDTLEYFGCAPALGECIELRKMGGVWYRVDMHNAKSTLVQTLENAFDAEDKAVRDPVPHYQRGGLECIDAMRAISTPEEFRGYLKLTAFKYLWRLGEKDLPVKEAKKAKDYITWLHEELAKT